MMDYSGTTQYMDYFMRLINGVLHTACLWFLCLCTAVLYSIPGYGRTQIIDGNDGLSNSSVTAIVRDRQGLMWIGTKNGLNIYDGYMFTRPYRELSSLPITSLVYNDRLNTVWVGTDKGLYVVEGNVGAVRSIGMNTEWGSSRVTALLRMPDSSICAAYQSGVIIHIGRNYEVTIIARLITKKEGFPFYAQSIASAPDGNLFFCTGEKNFYRLDLKTRKINTVRLDKDPEVIFLKHDEDMMLVVTRTGVLLIDPHSYVNRTPASLNKLNMANGHGNVSARYGNRLYLLYNNTRHFMLDLSDGAVTRIYEQYPAAFKSSTDHCIFQDENEIIWLGTERGIIKIVDEKKLFERILYNEASMRAITEDEAGDLYAGSYGGLYHYSKKEGVWKCYGLITLGQKLYPATPFSLTHGRDGYIYIASEFAPLYRFNKKKKKFETDFYDKAALQHISRAFFLFTDDSGLIWIGSNNGLLTFDPATKKMTHHQKDRYDIGRCVVRQISGGRDKNILWVATDNGLFRVHRERGVLERLHNESVPSLSHNDIYFAEEDSQGNLWLGTNGGGISIVAQDMKQVQYLNKEKNGLSSDIVYGMLHQDNGKVWISTFNGLSCYDPGKKTFSNYYTTDGLNDNEFNQNSYFKDRAGKMYFGGVRGISAFYPDDMEQRKMPPCSLFVSPTSKWNSEARSFTAISELSGADDQIILYAPNASLIFNLGLTDYRDPKYNSFSYRVRGLFDDWVSLQGQPVLRLNSIPYGRYTVEIKALNAQGIAASNMLRFHLFVKIPFYKTWWFYLLLLMLAGVLIYIFFQMKFRNLKQLQQLRVQIASDLHDEVGSLLTRITLFSDNVRFGRNTGKEKETKLEKIAALSRDATTTMSDILWAIDARNDFAGNLADRMREHAEDMLLPMNIEFQLDVSDVHQKQKISSEVRQQLYLIFKEAINNIVKHTRATDVQVVCQYDSEHFSLRIMNNGVERPLDTPVTGQGLKNMEMRSGKIGAHMHYVFSEEQFVLSIEKRTT